MDDARDVHLVGLCSIGVQDDLLVLRVSFRKRSPLHLAREGLHLRARNPIAEAQRSLLNCWMVNGYKFR